jgi:hypothetical protein
MWMIEVKFVREKKTKSNRHAPIAVYGSEWRADMHGDAPTSSLCLTCHRQIDTAPDLSIRKQLDKMLTTVFSINFVKFNCWRFVTVL